MCKKDTAEVPIEEEATLPVKEYILEDIRKHNRVDSAWVAVHNQVLDITKFAEHHPGGKDLILLAAGRDATVLFETYHPRTPSASILKKYQIGVLKEETPSFYSWESKFYPTLKARVVQRLQELKLSRRGGYSIQIKAICLVFGFWFSLIQMYTQSFGSACLWSMTMGIIASFVGTCIQHDGNHGAFSKSSFLNKVAGWTMDMIGASAFTWELQHMLGHHPYTNLLDIKEEVLKEQGIDNPMKDFESDPDVFSSYPLVRMHPYHPVYWYNKYQHIYSPILFFFMTLSRVFQQDIEAILTGRLYHIDATPRYSNPINVLRFWFMKAVSLVYMILLPCYFHGITKGLCLFLLGHCTCGQLLATMFIVNHVIDGVAFAEKQEETVEKKPHTILGVTPMKSLTTSTPLNDWAAVQCQTSVNWSSGSWFWNHFSGGLNHQIEHHLFPSICHTNYVYIQDVVQSTCAEFGVPYRSETNLATAYGKMIRHLYLLGNGADLQKND